MEVVSNLCSFDLTGDFNRDTSSRFRDGFLNAISCCPFVKHYRRKCQRTRFHRNFQTLIVSSDVDHAPLPGQLSQKYNRKVPQKHQTTNSAMA
ncbi:expressed protein [Echinococcus multilocularis]|uniref:Expressed protein n=1 Tax=Echinococcus multilocularis TaxID=6211 RepID=A0A087VXT9_ECHMU|nr:expressed protein [Echinococcus multilocularis]